MAEEAVSPKGCGKKGCIGCAAVFAALAAIPMVLLLVGLFTRPGEARPETKELTRPLPALPAEAPASPSQPTSPGSNPPAAPLPGTLESRELGTSLGGEPVRLVLNLSKGFFVVEPGPAGEPLRVQADYDAARYELEEIYDEGDRRYEIRFDARHGWASLIGSSENSNHVRVIVPRGYPLTIEGKIAMGESHVELGGLSLAETNLDFGMGDHSLSFSEPTTAPLERLEVDGSMGELTIDDVGNASPRLLRFGHSMGDLDVDLSGPWRNDAEIEVRCGMGQCRVRTPDGVAVAIERASIGLGEATTRGADRDRVLPPGAPTLTIRASGTMGQLIID